MAEKPKAQAPTPDYALAAFELRLQGASYTEIAAAMQVTVEEVKQAVARRAREVDAALDSPAVVETLAVARVDALLMATMADAGKGDTRAVATVLALERRRDVLRDRAEKRLGLDAWRLDLDLPLDGDMP